MITLFCDEKDMSSIIRKTGHLFNAPKDIASLKKAGDLHALRSSKEAV
jgi:hypothetical protein